MKILHYSLGFPPYRTGGLTKFTIDLMKQQRADGHEVSMLWPGHYSLLGKKSVIVQRKSVDGIKSFELINPNPVPYDEGILDVAPFLREGNKDYYKSFIKKIAPDVIHMETLMGIHSNFIAAAKEAGVRIVFTAHDFFPICTKVTLYKNGDVCKNAQRCNYCAKCNETALSLNKIKVLQSVWYRKLKDSVVIKRLRKRHRDSYLSEKESCFTEVKDETAAEQYRKLREYYKSILSTIDVVHYNSELTKRVYESFFGRLVSKVIPISHADIKDQRKEREYSGLIRYSYLGPYGSAKGFFQLQDSLNHLWDENNNFCLNVFFTQNDLPEYVIQHERYSYNQLGQIFDNTDVLLVPSILFDTFGYTVIEALSFGVPVIVSSHVGAQDVIPEGAGIVYEVEDKKALLQALKSINKDRLVEMNRAICRGEPMMEMSDMAYRIKKEIYAG